MTSEIVVMNKEAIALAADSAVTFPTKGKSKIFTSANKIFALSKYYPVGIMVYGSAHFMGVPWETIIKIYRQKLGEERFGNLEKYADHFINFLKTENTLSSDFEQEKYLRDCVYSYLHFIKSQIEERIKNVLLDEGSLPKKEVLQIASEVIDDHYSKWEEASILPSIPDNHIENLIKKYRLFFDEAKNSVFEELQISDDLSKKLTKICASLFAKSAENFEYSGCSGVVIAGFGENEIFPSNRSFFVEGIVDGVLKLKEHRLGKITHEMSAEISSFAQSEMAVTFINGVAMEYYLEITNNLRDLVNNYPDTIIDSIQNLSDNEKKTYKKKVKKSSGKILEECIGRLDDYRRKKYVDPLMDVVAMLPKNELALMAESLVKLTSFRMKVTMEEETVAEPIDVVVITKGDGLIWIKRKHYFKPELNPQFLANYNRRCE